MHPNISAYQNVENISSFDKKNFEDYCDSKLRECDKHVAFIKKQCIGENYTGKILEIGSGNGKLLYRLEQEGLVEQAIGYEFSASRAEFAKHFSTYVGSKKVTTVCADFVEENIEEDKYDIVIGVDIVPQLIAPLSDNTESVLFEKCKNILKPTGTVIFELLNFEKIMKMIELNAGELRLWKEFEQYDPWQYGLDFLSLDEKNIIWEKLFINRDRNIPDSGFKNILRQYTPSDIEIKLERAGFSGNQIHFFDCWEEAGDIPDNEYIVTAVN